MARNTTLPRVETPFDEEKYNKSLAELEESRNDIEKYFSQGIKPNESDIKNFSVEEEEAEPFETEVHKEELTEEENEVEKSFEEAKKEFAGKDETVSEETEEDAAPAVEEDTASIDALEKEFLQKAKFYEERAQENYKNQQRFQALEEENRVMKERYREAMNKLQSEELKREDNHIKNLQQGLYDAMELNDQNAYTRIMVALQEALVKRELKNNSMSQFQENQYPQQPPPYNPNVYNPGVPTHTQTPYGQPFIAPPLVSPLYSAPSSAQYAGQQMPQQPPAQPAPPAKEGLPSKKSNDTPVKGTKAPRERAFDKVKFHPIEEKMIRNAKWTRADGTPMDYEERRRFYIEAQMPTN